MSKIIVQIFLIIFFTNAFGEVIKNVEVSGNKRISKETVLVLGNISTGQNFEKKDLNNSLKKLYDSNFFKDIQLTINNGKHTKALNGHALKSNY